MLQGKALTFSYDDGEKQDIRLIQLFNKYGLKGTFNLNSGLMAKSDKMPSSKVALERIKEVYEGHEVAVHTLTHPCLPDIADDAEIIRQVEADRINLSNLVGYEVVGMAYPSGGINNDDRVAEIIKNNTGVEYSRTITTTRSFDIQENLYRFNPTSYHLDFEELMQLGKEFVELKTETPKIFYIWGHSYEMDFEADYWVKLEEFFKLISNKDDIFYGTNKEILL